MKIPGWLVSVPCWCLGNYSKAMWHQGGGQRSLRYEIGMVSTCICSQQVTSLITFRKFWKLHLKKRTNRKLWWNPLWNATSLPSWDSKSTETQIVVVTSLPCTLLQNGDESELLKHPKWPRMVGVWESKHGTQMDGRLTRITPKWRMKTRKARLIPSWINLETSIPQVESIAIPYMTQIFESILFWEHQWTCFVSKHSSVHKTSTSTVLSSIAFDISSFP